MLNVGFRLVYVSCTCFFQAPMLVQTAFAHSSFAFFVWLLPPQPEAASAATTTSDMTACWAYRRIADPTSPHRLRSRRLLRGSALQPLTRRARSDRTKLLWRMSHPPLGRSARASRRQLALTDF